MSLVEKTRGKSHQQKARGIRTHPKNNIILYFYLGLVVNLYNSDNTY